MRDELAELAERMALEMGSHAEEAVNRRCAKNSEAYGELLAEASKRHAAEVAGHEQRFRVVSAKLAESKASFAKYVGARDGDSERYFVALAESRAAYEAELKSQAATHRTRVAYEAFLQSNRDRLILGLQEKLEERDGTSGAGLAGLLLGAIAVGTLWTVSLLF